MLVGLAYPILGILGLLIHIWTIIIAYASGGIFSAMISLVLPVLSQIFWGIKVWTATETFFNLYCLAIVGYVILWIIAIIGISMAES